MARKAAVPNDALYNLRDARGETQQDVADALARLGTARDVPVSVAPTANHVSRWERGLVRPTGIYRQLLAEHFEVSVAELGLTRQRVSSTGTTEPADVGGSLALVDDDPEGDPYVAAAQSDWRQVRAALNRRRMALSRAVAGLYPADQRVGLSGLIAPAAWMAERPVDLGDVALAFHRDQQEPALTGSEEQAARSRPLETVDQRYPRYSLAIRDLDRPRLFENRTAWRLLHQEPTETGVRMDFADTTYFDAVDVSESLAHEAAGALLVGDEAAVTPNPSMREMPFRRMVGDPFDGSRRPILPSADTLTIRQDRDGASFVLHNRNAGNVVTAGGMLHIMPAGVFQPSSVRNAAQTADFDLWRNIAREYSEEFLGNAEHGGDGQLIDYGTEPFASFDAARTAGTLRAYWFGTALDALTLWGEILTVAVFDADVYDRIFADMVHQNDEGSVVRTGRVHPTSAIPFTEHVVRELLDGGRLAPAAAGCLQLAWDHRRDLLG